MRLREPGRSRNRDLKSRELLTEQREVEKSHSQRFVSLLERQGIFEFSFSDPGLALAAVANPELLDQSESDLHLNVVQVAQRFDKIRTVPDTIKYGLARVLEPKATLPTLDASLIPLKIGERARPLYKERGAVAAAVLTSIGFPELKSEIVVSIKRNVPDFLERINKRPYVHVSSEPQEDAIIVPALARMVGLLTEAQVDQFKSEFLSVWEENFAKSCALLEGDTNAIKDEDWIKRTLELALALEILQATEAYIDEQGKPMIKRSSSMGATHQLPERPVV